MSGPAPQYRVLIAGEDAGDRAIIRDAIAEIATVDEATSARACLDALVRQPADLVLASDGLGDMRALELLGHLSEFSNLDVVLFGALTSRDTVLEAIRSGAVDCLTKPIQGDEVHHLVVGVLERRGLQTENEHLRTLLSTMDDCRSLAAAVEPAEIHAIALEVLLRRLNRSRGLAVFRGNLGLDSEDLVVRGYSDIDTEQLRAAFGGPKRPVVEALGEAQVQAEGEVLDLLREAGVAATSCLLVPMDAPNQGDSGFVLLPDDGRAFVQDDLEVARMVASYGQVGVYNAERYQRAKERAFVDDVTDVYNARYLFASLEHELRRADRYQSELSLIFLDIDRFKLVNDRHGHLVGSRTLRALTHVLSSCIRQVDTLARYGGDEFTILLADTDHATATRVAERIRAAVARTPFEAQGGPSLQITVSVGVGTFPRHGASAEALLDAADKAMYRAKSLGRNRVCSAAELEEN